MPTQGDPVVALVGRSNVGKSSLINALVHRKLARAGATPGTTRLLNVYRLRLAVAPPGTARRLMLIDLPGYGYARGGAASTRSFDRLMQAFFGQAGGNAAVMPAGVLLVVDARHPGLANDRAACAWLTDQGHPLVVVATKIDRVSRAGRSRATRQHEDALGAPVWPVSAKTGEGLDKLWTEITKWLRRRASLTASPTP